MTQIEILAEVRKLTPTEQQDILTAIQQLVQAESHPRRLTRVERRQGLAAGAAALRADYAAGGELTIFTALDGEDFLEPG